ncbi:MAG: hypothetical protein M0P11_02730 [Anaerolineaceae bacterium]|nr:hypothetical protein [Anaerolineaceae bacterium]
MASSLSSILFNGFLPDLLAQENQSANWVTVVIGILLILALIGLLIWLYTTGKLAQWFKAGTQSGKWKIQDMQLSNEAKKTERIKTGIIEELGQKAWQSGVSDPSYAQAWADIEVVETQINRIKDHSRTLQDQLNQASSQQEDVSRNFNDQIEQLDDQRKETEAKLKHAQSQLRQLESDLDSLSTQKSDLQRSIKATRTDLINAEGLDDPDRPEILERLNARLNELVQQLLKISNHEPELAGQIPANQSEVLTLNARVTELGDQIRRLESQKAQELEPIQLQIEALEKQLRAKNEEIKELEKKTEPMIKSLGYLVDTARPDSEALREEYTQLDDVYQKLADTTQERTEIVTNLESLDKEASRNFYLLILLGIIALVVGILLISGVL